MRSNPRVLLDHARAAAAEARRADSRDVLLLQRHHATAKRWRASTSRGSCAKPSRAARSACATRAGTICGPAAGSRGWATFAGFIRCAAKFARRNSCASRRPPGSRRACRAACWSTLPQDFAELSAQCGSGCARLVRRAPRSRSARGLRSRHENFLGERRAAGAARAANRGESLRRARSADLRSLQRRGVQFVVDEVGARHRLADLAGAGARVGPAARSRLGTGAAQRHGRAQRCRAGIAWRRRLCLTPIATGVDDQAQRDALLELGCLLRHRRPVRRLHVEHARAPARGRSPRRAPSPSDLTPGVM